MSTIAVVVNPIAGGGQGKKAWRAILPRLHAEFDKVVHGLSSDADDLKRMTRAFIADAPDLLLIIGGDGTLSNVLNGLIADDKLLNPAVKLAYLNAGSGGDFARQFPRQHLKGFVARIVKNESIQTNIGKITSAHNPVHYFINISSCGLSGYILQATAKNAWLKKINGRLSYFVQAVTGLMKYNQSRVRIQIDDKPSFECSMLLLAVCNGPFFGGRMHIAPLAKLNDGLLDVVLFRDFTKLEAVLKLPRIYTGGHLLDKNVYYTQGKKVSIEPLTGSEVRIEADGEGVGVLPAIFELLPESIDLIV